MYDEKGELTVKKKSLIMLNHDQKIREQFNIRSEEFDISANWITDEILIQTHVDLAGEPCGQALELCCGTGQVGRALKKKGWDVKGLDITERMVERASRYFPVSQGNAEKIPFEKEKFQLVVCRQSFQFLDAGKVLSEIKRVLIPRGIFVLSLTVPFSEHDHDWLSKIHKEKQPLLLKFYNAESLVYEVQQAGFSVEEIKTLTARESINRWMEHTPELTQKVKERICSMVENAPLRYKKLRRVKIVNREIFEDWNWVVMKSSVCKKIDSLAGQ